jgi:hypothetical protein
MPQIYNGFHLHHAIACIEAGRPDNAVTWMWRDLGEIATSEGEMPMAETLEIRWMSTGPGTRVIQYESADEFWQCIAGAGI